MADEEQGPLEETVEEGAAGGDPVPPPPKDILEYGDFHKLVLQGLMSAGMLDTKGVKRLFVGACSYLGMDPEETTSMQFVQKVVLGINDKIKRFDMTIRSASCELTGKKYYLFLLTVEKPIMKMQTLYTKFQTDHFQKVMDVILRKYSNFSVPLMECINLSLEIDVKSNLESAERFLLKMIHQNYLTKMIFGTSADDFDVTLGFRGIREFEPVLREFYDDVVSSCCFCKGILLHGFVCHGCKCHVHRHCYAKLKAGTRICPVCLASWEDVTCMKARVRDTSGAVNDDQRPGTSREAMAELRKQQLSATASYQENTTRETLDESGNLDEAETQDLEGEIDTHDIEGETDGVVTRDSDNDEESTENEGMPQLENMVIDSSAAGRVTRQQKKVKRGYSSESD